MMQGGWGAMGCGGGGWYFLGAHVVELVVLVLVAAALVKYLFFHPTQKSGS